MLRIRHRSRPYQQLEIEGSRGELSELRRAILSFCESPQGAGSLPATAPADAPVVGAHVKRLRLCKTTDLLLITVAGDQVLISGKPEFLRSFALELLPGGQPLRQVRDLSDCPKRHERISQADLSIVVRD